MPNMMVLGAAQDMRMEPSGMGLVFLSKIPRRAPQPLPPCEYTVEGPGHGGRGLSPDLQPSRCRDLGLPSPPNCENYISIA